MPRLVTYRCPECQGTFDFLHHPSDEPPPNECQICHASFSDEPEKAFVPKINIGTAKGKIPDRLYRDMEKGSEIRAEMAAEVGGGSASDYSALKITDMNDNLRQGDMAAKMNTAAAVRNLSQFGAPVGLQTSINAPLYREQARSGPAAQTTRKLIDGMDHQRLAADVTRASQIGKG